MNQITIRDVEARDLPEIKAIIDEIWEFSDWFETEGAADTALGIYFNQVLYGNSFGKAALLDGKVVGVIFGHVKGELPKYRMLQEDNTKYIMSLLNMHEDDRSIINEFISKMHYGYEELIAKKIDSYDGVLDFLIVSEKAQGLKIGKKLWDELAAYFRETKAKSIYVFTDTECNFGFYDHLGFSRKGERDVTYIFGDEPDEQYDETIFLYDYQFGKG